MCDEVVAIFGLPIECRAGVAYSGDSGAEELDEKGDAKEHRHVNRMRPPTKVALQFNTFTPVGIAISMDVIMKNRSIARPMPTVNI